MGGEWETLSAARLRRSSVEGTEPVPTPPKLCFHSLPVQRPDPPGMATPPLRLPGSVPFRWEEAPGRPRREQAPAAAARSLDLPPRMVSRLAEETGVGRRRISPTAMLDGPYPPASYSRSFAEGRSRDHGRRGRGGGGSRGSVTWLWRRWRSDGSWEGISPSSSTSSSSSSSAMSLSTPYGREEEGDEEHGSKVRITRMRRSSSLSTLSSHAGSHWLVNFYGILRQAIPRRRDNRI